MPPKRELTVEQEARVTAFANIHRARVAVQEVRLPELDELRRAALLGCLEVNVPNWALAEASGLSQGRVSQLVEGVGGRPDLRRRLIPE